jgi:hypothetical protein
MFLSKWLDLSSLRTLSFRGIFASPVRSPRRTFRVAVEPLEGRRLLSATYAAAVLATSPTAYWRLGEASGTNAADTSGNGNNATYVGSVALGQAGAIVADSNTAVGFTGAANTGVQLPSSVFNFPTTGSTTTYVRTFEAWFNTTSNGAILGQVGGDSLPPGNGSFSGWVPAVYVDSTGLLRVEMFWHGATNVQIVSPAKVNDGNWHHLVDVYNNGTETAYLDGASIGSQSATESSYNTGYSYYLGAGYTGSWPNAPSGAWSYFNGRIDEAAVYTTALSATQVMSHFNAGRSNDVSFKPTTYQVLETAGNVSVTLTRAGNLTTSDTVIVNTVNGTALAGADYAPLTNFSVTFAAGQSTATVSIAIINNPAVQPARSFTVKLTSPSGSPVISPNGTATVTIIDNTSSSGGSLGPILVYGTDAGVPGEVRVFSAATQALIYDFFPYGSGFKGGVHVAAGDVNGDGAPDIITGPGAGGGPLVNVYNGLNLGLIFSFNAYNPNFLNGVFVAVGDVNGDTHADIITAPDAGGGPLVEAFDGTTGNMLIAFNAYDPAFRGGVHVAAGDVTGAGRAQIITGPGFGGGPLVEVFDGTNGKLLVAFNAYAPAFIGGVFVATADTNGDGIDEIVTGPGIGGGSLVNLFNGATGQILMSFNIYNSLFIGGVRVGSLRDQNGNGATEIVTGGGPGGALMQQTNTGLAATVPADVFDGAALSLVDQLYPFDTFYFFGYFVAGSR